MNKFKKFYGNMCIHETSFKKGESILKDNKIKCLYDINEKKKLTHKNINRWYGNFVYCCAFLDINDTNYYGIGKNEILFVIDCSKLNRTPIYYPNAENGVVQIWKEVTLDKIIHIFANCNVNDNLIDKIKNTNISFSIGDHNDRINLIKGLKND